MYKDMKTIETNRSVEFACAAQTLRKAARLITRRYEDGLRQVNLTASQFSILQALVLHSELSFKIISSTLGLEQTTLSRLLKVLEKRELVTIEKSESDGRGRIISATTLGRQTFEEAELIWRPINEDCLSRLSKADWQGVKIALNKLSI
ncbi:MAG: MarR family winged helix-turn-helix transcriptional regulator [Nitratireductor sp.]